MRIITLQKDECKFSIKIMFYTVITVIFFSCSDKKNEVIHPRKEFIDKVEALKETISISDYEKTSSNLFTKSYSDTTYIGGGEVGSDEFIVDMKNAVIDDFGRVYVSIPTERKIKVFDKNGEFIRDIGRYGRGPGEFEFLSAIKYHSGKDLLVALDDKDIEIFSVSETEVKHQKKIYNYATQSTDLCLTRNKIIVNGFKVEEKDSVSNSGGFPDLLISPPMHTYSIESSEALVSFGEKYKSEHGWGIFDGMLSSMNVQCDEESNIVVGMMDIHPYLVGYDINSYQKIWESGIVDVNTINLSST